MEWIANIIFIAILIGASFFMYKSIKRIKTNILLGRDESFEGHFNERLKMMFLVAFGQQKMFKKPIPAFLHLFVYVGFIVVNLEMLEIVIDGVFGTHRVFYSLLGNAYVSFINLFEFFAVAVLLACLLFIVRRVFMGIDRFKKPEMEGKASNDAMIILVVEISLMIAFLTMNAADMQLQNLNTAHYSNVGTFFFSSYLLPIIANLSEGTLIFIERVAWWFHIIGVLMFANYVFYKSKHLHIFLAFPNTFYSRLTPAGQVANMPVVTKEVKSMLGLPVEEELNNIVPPARFGAKDVTDLSWKNIMEAYTCTECGRCTQQCPANITGKSLSPRKIMMDVRKRAESLGELKEKNGKDYIDENTLLGSYITDEEILACTTCNACVEACPVNINPVNIILQLRQYNIMEESKAPQSWNMMFNNLDSSFSPWKFSPQDRYSWSNKLND